MGPARKLRESCDSCHTAKVKCIKTKADCVRCSSSGVICSFSPSDRRGKPRGAKNKVNRIPPPLSTQQRVPTVPDRTADPYPSPSYDFNDFFHISERVDLLPDNLQSPLGENTSLFNLSLIGQGNTQAQSSSPMMDGNWMNMESLVMSTQQSPLPQLSPNNSIPSYPEPPVGVPAIPYRHPVSRPQQSPQLYDEYNLFEALSNPSENTKCSCFPVNLQSLYTLHCNSFSSAANVFTPFDIALFINNKALNRCMSMLTCGYCVLNTDYQKSSTSMLMIAAAVDDILMSFSTTCMAYLDTIPQGTFVLSSGDNSSSSATTMTKTEDHDYARQSSIASTSSSSLSNMYPSSELSLGNYRVEGEDGRHLKLEILKIELRKVERLWTAFRDTCALQKFEDDQKSLYAALVCYLAKKLRRTSEMLEARRRVRDGWLGMS